VRLGGSIQADMNIAAPAGLAFDNVRIYDTVIPESASIGMILSGSAFMLFVRRRLMM